MSNCRRKIRGTLIAAAIFVSSFALQNTPALQDRKKALFFTALIKTKKKEKEKNWVPWPRKEKGGIQSDIKSSEDCHNINFGLIATNRLIKPVTIEVPASFFSVNQTLHFNIFYTATQHINSTTRSQSSTGFKKCTRLSDDSNNDWVGEKQRSCYIQTYGAPDPCVPKLSLVDDQPNIQNTKDKWKKILPRNQPRNNVNLNTR